MVLVIADVLLRNYLRRAA